MSSLALKTRMAQLERLLPPRVRPETLVWDRVQARLHADGPSVVMDGAAVDIPLLIRVQAGMARSAIENPALEADFGGEVTDDLVQATIDAAGLISESGPNDYTSGPWRKLRPEEARPLLEAWFALWREESSRLVL